MYQKTFLKQRRNLEYLENVSKYFWQPCKMINKICLTRNETKI